MFSDSGVVSRGAKTCGTTLGCQSGVPAPLSGEFAGSLSKDHFYSGTMPGIAGYSNAMQDLLLLTPALPHSAQPGTSMRAWRMLRHLSGSYRVHLGCFTDESADRRHEGFVRQFCHSVFFA